MTANTKANPIQGTRTHQLTRPYGAAGLVGWLGGARFWRYFLWAG